MPDWHLARRLGHHISAACLTPYGESYTEKDTKKSLTILTTFSWLAQLKKNVRKPLHYLIHFIRKLGLHVSWTKVIGPTQHVTFLGVDIDTVECTLLLGHEKLRKLHGILKTFIAKWWATKVLLQSLAGSLNWVYQVVRGGCFFLWCIVDIIKPLLQARYKTFPGNFCPVWQKAEGGEGGRGKHFWSQFLPRRGVLGIKHPRRNHEVHGRLEVCCLSSLSWPYSRQSTWPLYT